MALLNPAAPEASACSAAGIHWALEDLVASCLHHRQWHEVQARSKLVHACLGLLLPVQTASCPLLPAPARSCPPAPHEVGVCHRLCPVSFSNFVCLFGFARLLVSAPSRLLPAPARSTRSRCLSQVMPCVFSRLRVTFRGRGRGRAPRVSFRGRGQGPKLRGGYPASAVAHPRTRTNTKRGPVSRPPLYPINGLNVTACRTRSPKLRCLPVPSDAVACSTGS